MKRLFIIAAIISFSAIAKDDYPGDWQGFKDSPLPEDKNLVASIERTAKKNNTLDLCAEWGRGERAKKETRRNRAIFEYLLTKNMINTTDTSSVKERHVTVGMSGCGVVASLGRATRSHTRETARGFSVQMIYERDGYYNKYIHLDFNGENVIVTSISN